MTVNSKMTALANEIRELSGTTDTKNLDEMRVDVDAANTEIAEQAELIAQIATALEGKASGVEYIDEEVAEYTSLNAELEAVINSLPDAGGSGGGNVETCTVMSTSTNNNKSVYYTEGSGNLQNVPMSMNEVATFTVLKNTIMYVNNATTASISGDCTTLYNSMGKGIFVISGDCTISF